MCYLGLLPRKNAMSLEDMRNAFDHNSDGYGVMYAEGGRVVHWKHKGDFDAFAAHFATLPDNRQIAVHFRFGTSGPTNSDACHPFMVLNKETHGMDLYLMHNGVLDYRVFAGTKKASDTMQYVAKLRTMLQGNPTLIRNAAFREVLERDLGNPNKMVLLEGSGRWHVLNRYQGTEDKASGVWHSNTYSLAKVYSGHGKGKAANRAPAWNHDDWEDAYPTLYGSNGVKVTRNDSGNFVSPAGNTNRALDAAYKRAMQDDKSELTWALQIVRVDGKSEEQVWWKKGYTGWLRMGRNSDTLAFYRDFQFPDCITILPANTIKFRPKDEKKWERGDAHTWTMEGGEHVPVPVAITGTAAAATATLLLAKPQQHTMLLDEKDVARVADSCGVRMNSLCPETNEPCAAGCVESCTGQAIMGAASNSAGTFPLASHATHARADSTSLVARMATLEEQDEAEDDDEDENYVEQLFSETNLRTMTEQDMWEAVCDYPDAAAVALGRALNLRWAYESEVA